VKRLLNTLYVTTDASYISRKRETVEVRVEGETRLRIPIHALDGIVCFGRVSCSPHLLGLCGERGVTISFLDAFGRFRARTVGPVSGNVLLRREQYRRADCEADAAHIARLVVAAKVTNSRAVLMRAAREANDSAAAGDLRGAAEGLARNLARLKHEMPLHTVRGIEGEAARGYFGAFDRLVLAQREDFRFSGRTRRPPTDNINAILSFLYAILAHDASSALEGVGLDPAVGFLHRDRPGRPGLALDLMEEFRAYMADRAVLSLVNRRQVRAAGFRKTETGAVLMDEATRKTVLQAWQSRKRDEIRHPFLGETVPVGLLPHVQAMLLARHLRGDLDEYPPFVWK